MDTVTVIIRVLGLIPGLIPPPKPPVIDYISLHEALPKLDLTRHKTTETNVQTDEQSVATIVQKVSSSLPSQKDVSTGCIPCSRSHLSTVSGALGESLRFARESGIAHPEVQRRLMLAEDEINIMERIDLAPDALLKSPKQEQDLAHQFLPRIRELRQDIGSIKSVDELEKTAASASVLGQEFRLRHLQLRGVDLNPVLELAKRVQAGEITMAEAKEKLKTLLPDEG